MVVTRSMCLDDIYSITISNKKVEKCLKKRKKTQNQIRESSERLHPIDSHQTSSSQSVNTNQNQASFNQANLNQEANASTPQFGWKRRVYQTLTTIGKIVSVVAGSGGLVYSVYRIYIDMNELPMEERFSCVMLPKS